MLQWECMHKQVILGGYLFGLLEQEAMTVCEYGA